MIVKVNNVFVNPEIWQVPNMNFGQMQRWTEFVPLAYSFEISKEIFLERTADFFEQFRQEEIADDDTDEFPELSAYKKIGWPPMEVLIDEHLDLFSELLKFNDYEFLIRLCTKITERHDYFYSVNSLDRIKIQKSRLILEGICFKSDYIEHTYNVTQSKEHALLK